jgi:hypothetical protein
MLRSAAIAGLVLALALALPAQATDWIDCSDGEALNAGVSLLVGAGDVLSVVAAKLDVHDHHWVTSEDYAEGEGSLPLAVGQAFEDPETIRVDLMDEALNDKLAELRLFKAAEGRDVVYAGILRAPGLGAWAVTCTGP